MIEITIGIIFLLVLLLFDIHIHYFYICSKCVPLTPFSAGRGKLKPPTQFSKRGGLTGLQFLERVAGKEGVTFFREVAIFT